MRKVYDAIKLEVAEAFASSPVYPELHAPKQQQGNIAEEVGLFPNRRAVVSSVAPDRRPGDEQPGQGAGTSKPPGGRPGKFGGRTAVAAALLLVGSSAAAAAAIVPLVFPHPLKELARSGLGQALTLGALQRYERQLNGPGPAPTPAPTPTPTVKATVTVVPTVTPKDDRCRAICEVEAARQAELPWRADAGSTQHYSVTIGQGASACVCEGERRR